MPPILPTDVPEPEGSEDETANAPVPAAYHADDSSDDEDVDLGSGDEEHAGYQLLPQQLDSDEDAPDALGNPALPTVFAEAFSQAPNEWRPTEDMLRPVEPRPLAEPMAQAQVEAVKAAMAGFELPASQRPAWAQDVPEEEWKQCLYDRLQLRGRPEPGS